MDVGVACKFLGRARQPEPAVLQHVAATGELERERHLLFGDDEREAGVAQPRECAIRLDREPRREPRRRLVEHQHLRFGHQRPAHREHLLLAAAHRSGILTTALGEPREQVEHELLAPRFWATRKRAEGEVLGDGHVREQMAFGRHVRQPATRDPMGRQPRDVGTVE